MSFCIGILSYNHPEITKKVVSSTLKFNVPVYLVHNGSKIENIKKLQEEFPQINHLVVEKNSGYTGGVNFLFSSLFNDYDWIYFLTNDTELIALGDLPSEPALIAPKIYFRKLNRIDSVGGVFIPHLGKLLHCKEDSSFKNSSTQFKYVPGTAFLLHKDIFNSVGKFDESLHTYWEDVDFSARANLKKLPILVNEKFEVLHKVGKTCHDDMFYTTYLFRRNRKRVSRRYTSSFWSRITLELVLVKDSLITIFKLLRAKNYSKLKLFIKSIQD